MGEELTGGGRGGVLAWLALQQAPEVGPATMLRLARVFGSAEAALAAPEPELIGRGGLSAEQAGAIASLRGSEDLLARKVEAWRAQGVEVVAIGDSRYPRQLEDLRNPPPIIFLRGAPPAADARAVAVVGTRTPDRRGSAVARRLAREFAQRGLAIVSGLARGVDTAAHRGALRAAQGRTIAVLGSGIFRIYPPENAVLAQRIASRGCLIAEVPPETEVQTAFLLMRDRLQAALSRAVIVVQAYAECGSIVTARHAVECGRLLYAVPWSSPPFSEGWRTLQSLGARPITAEADFDAIAADVDAHVPQPLQPPLP